LRCSGDLAEREAKYLLRQNDNDGGERSHIFDEEELRKKDIAIIPDRLVIPTMQVYNMKSDKFEEDSYCEREYFGAVPIDGTTYSKKLNSSGKKFVRQ
jgi:hypothetical protein